MLSRSRICCLLLSPFQIRHGGFLKESCKVHSDRIRRPFQILPFQFPPTLHCYRRHFRRILLPLLLFLSQSGKCSLFCHLHESDELVNQICAVFFFFFCRFTQIKLEMRILKLKISVSFNGFMDCSCKDISVPININCRFYSLHLYLWRRNFAFFVFSTDSW